MAPVPAEAESLARPLLHARLSGAPLPEHRGRSAGLLVVMIVVLGLAIALVVGIIVAIVAFALRAAVIS